MKKLSEYKNEEAIELLADIMEPVSEILADDEVKNTYRSGANKIALVKVILKHHSKQVVDILAILDGIPREEYKCNVVTLPIKLIEIFNDEELTSFFESQSQILGEELSGSVTENTEATEEI